jgi:hypothetical protein
VAGKAAIVTVPKLQRAIVPTAISAFPATFGCSGRGRLVEALPFTEVLRRTGKEGDLQAFANRGGELESGPHGKAEVPVVLCQTTKIPALRGFPFSRALSRTRTGDRLLTMEDSLSTDVGRDRAREAILPAISPIQTLSITCLGGPRVALRMPAPVPKTHPQRRLSQVAGRARRGGVTHGSRGFQLFRGGRLSTVKMRRRRSSRSATG